MPATSPVACGSLNIFVNAGTCEVSNPIIPARNGPSAACIRTATSNSKIKHSDFTAIGRAADNDNQENLCQGISLGGVFRGQVLTRLVIGAGLENSRAFSGWRASARDGATAEPKKTQTAYQNTKRNSYA